MPASQCARSASALAGLLPESAAVVAFALLRRVRARALAVVRADSLALARIHLAELVLVCYFTSLARCAALKTTEVDKINESRGYENKYYM
jgi:hypothetical protein